MRLTRMLLLFMLLFSFCGLAMTQSGETELKQKIKNFKNSRRFFVKYDKFKDKTVVTVGPFALTGSMEYAFTNSMVGILAGFGFEGETLQKPVGTFYIGFDYSGKEWEFLKERDVYALVDGERMKFGEAARDSDIKLGSVKEVLSIAVDADAFDKIANAKVVEMKVGDREFKLKAEHLQAFRDLLSLSKMRSQPAPSSSNDREKQKESR